MKKGRCNRLQRPFFMPLSMRGVDVNRSSIKKRAQQTVFFRIVRVAIPRDRVTVIL